MKKILFLVIMSLFFSSCVSTGKLEQKNVLVGSLKDYSNLVVSILEKEPSAKKSLVEATATKKILKVCIPAFTSFLDETKPFKTNSVKLKPSKEDELQVVLVVSDYTEGDSLGRAFSVGGSEEEVKFLGKIIDLKSKKTLSTFELSGNSARQSKVIVGAFDTSLLDSLLGRACTAASEHLVNFLNENNGSKT